MENNVRVNYNPIIVGIAFLVVAVAYAIMPIDAIPDFLIGLGQMDDAAVILIAFLAEVFNLIYGLILRSRTYNGEI